MKALPPSGGEQENHENSTWKAKGFDVDFGIQHEKKAHQQRLMGLFDLSKLQQDGARQHQQAENRGARVQGGEGILPVS